MRVLILGGSGMLGHKLWQTLAPRFDAYVTFRGDVRAYARAGLFDADAVEKLARKCRASGRSGGRGRIGIGDNMALVGILSTQLLDHHFVGGSRAQAPYPAAAVFA